VTAIRAAPASSSTEGDVEDLEWRPIAIVQVRGPKGAIRVRITPENQVS
jgi:hypothetical protein